MPLSGCCLECVCPLERETIKIDIVAVHVDIHLVNFLLSKGVAFKSLCLNFHMNTDSGLLHTILFHRICVDSISQYFQLTSGSDQ